MKKVLNENKKDAASVVVEIRITIAHETFELDAKNNKVILLIRGILTRLLT